MCSERASRCRGQSAAATPEMAHCAALAAVGKQEEWWRATRHVHNHRPSPHLAPFGCSQLVASPMPKSSRKSMEPARRMVLVGLPSMWPTLHGWGVCCWKRVRGGGYLGRKAVAAHLEREMCACSYLASNTLPAQWQPRPADLLMVRSRVSMLVREAMEEKGSHIVLCVLARSERPPQLEAALLPR